MAEDAKVGSIGGGGNCKDETVERSPLISKNWNGATGYLTPCAKQAFTQLKQAFTKAPILQHFDPKCHIRIETDVSGYAIGGVLSQLTLDNLGQWPPVAFYSQKMIPAETQYKTHDSKLLAIIKAFKIWRHYLKGCKYKVLMLTNYNNLCHYWIQRVWALGRSVRPRSSLDIIFGLIIIKARQMRLQMHCFVFFRETRIKKKSFGLRTLEFFIVCSPH